MPRPGPGDSDEAHAFHADDMLSNDADGYMRDDEPDEEWEAKPYEQYWWDCPACGETNDCGDIEPHGEEQCEFCQATVTVKR